MSESFSRLQMETVAIYIHIIYKKKAFKIYAKIKKNVGLTEH